MTDRRNKSGKGYKKSNILTIKESFLDEINFCKGYHLVKKREIEDITFNSFYFQISAFKFFFLFV